MKRNVYLSSKLARTACVMFFLPMVVTRAQPNGPTGTGSTVSPAIAAAEKPHSGVPGPRGAPQREDDSLAVDQPNRVYTAKSGETHCTFNYHLTNVSTDEVVITDVMPSCGCTMAKLPSKPWVLAAGHGGDLKITVDVTGKSGTLTKTAKVLTQKGSRLLTMQINVPLPTMNQAARARNVQIAQMNRQAVFQGDCASCHVPPLGLTGEPLYKAACGLCHESEHRASMVPDLRALPHATNRDFWKSMILAGKPGTLMPGFSRDIDGPLSRVQIDSIADYLTSAYLPKLRSPDSH